MSVSNPLHVSCGKVTIHKTDGSKITATLLDNDYINRCFRLELSEGDFEVISYDDFDRAQVWLRERAA